MTVNTDRLECQEEQKKKNLGVVKFFHFKHVILEDNYSKATHNND